MYKLTVYVTLKKDVHDPQGKAICEAASSLGIKNILNIKQGQYFEVLLKDVSNKNKAKHLTKSLSEKLLCNEVIEDYKIVTITKV